MDRLNRRHPDQVQEKTKHSEAKCRGGKLEELRLQRLARPRGRRFM
jgi:hypothetical protein